MEQTDIDLNLKIVILEKMIKGKGCLDLSVYHLPLKKLIICILSPL